MKIRPGTVEHDLDRELRYIAPSVIANDFPGKRERAAISAVLEWLGLNSVCAWRDKRTGAYSTTWIGYRSRRRRPHDAVVMSAEQLERAEKLLSLKKPRSYTEAPLPPKRKTKRKQ